MSWEDLLDEGSERVLPWYGFGRIHDAKRSWRLTGPRPPEHGWYRFETGGGRNATVASRELHEPDLSWADNQPQLRGYLVGDHFIPDNVASTSRKLIPTYCVEFGLERFARVTVVRDREGNLVYISQEFPSGPEEEVRRAYQDRLDNLDHIANVTPALDLAFRWITRRREEQEERRRELERIRAEELARQEAQARLEKAMRDAGTAAGRRTLAQQDFDTAAREALRVSGAELLDTRDSYERGEKVVQYRFRERRLECVVEARTLQVVDSGICLTDHRTGEKGDTYFTLESLPGVVGEAMDLGKLVVYRHVDGDWEDDW